MSDYDIDTNEFGGTDYRKEGVLRELYWERRMTSREIASVFDIDKTTVLRWMDKNGIDAKDKTDRPATFSTDPNGRERWSVSDNGNMQVVSVQRLTAVAEYGFENVVGSDIHHKIPIPWLNYIDNLEPIDHGEHLRQHNLGNENSNRTLDKDDVRKIKRRLENGNQSHSEIADEFPISRRTVSNIAAEDTWSHVDPAPQ